MLSRLGTAFEVDISVVQVNCDRGSLNAGKLEIAPAVPLVGPHYRASDKQMSHSPGYHSVLDPDWSPDMDPFVMMVATQENGYAREDITMFSQILFSALFGPTTCQSDQRTLTSYWQCRRRITKHLLLMGVPVGTCKSGLRTRDIRINHHFLYSSVLRSPRIKLLFTLYPKRASPYNNEKTASSSCSCPALRDHR